MGPRMNRLEEIYTLKTVIESRQLGFNILNDMECVYNNNFVRYILSYDDTS